MRRLIHESDDRFERQANEFLEGYYRQLVGPAATAEAIYHASRLDVERGVREWVKAFDSAFWASDYPLCRALLALRGALGVTPPLESGMMTRCEGDFCYSRALYAESESEYKKALKYLDRAEHENDSPDLQKCKALVFHNLGEVQSELSRPLDGAASYQKVIDICDLMLRAAKDDSEVYDLKAGGYLGLGDINIWGSKSKPAIECYSAAITVCDEALQKVQGEPLEGRLDPIVLHLFNDKAYGLSGIADVEASLYRHREAIRSYRQALSCYDEALRRAADPVIQNDKAYTLVSMAESGIALSQHASALEHCQQAVSIYDDILRRAPEDIIYHCNKSRALRTAGDSLTRLLRYDDALRHYKEAIDACAEPLRQAPNYMWALCNMGLVLLSLGKLHSEKSEYPEALRSFTESLDAFESYLAQSPDDDEALAGKGRVLFNTGEVLSKTPQCEAAIEEYRQSVVSFDRALEDAPEDIEARKDKGRVLHRLGELYVALERGKDALHVLDDASIEYARVLDISPQYGPVREWSQQLAAFIGKLRGDHE